MPKKLDTDLRTLLDALPVIIALADKGRRYRYVNKRFLDLSGLDRDQVVGHEAEEVLGEAYEIIRPQHERVLAGEAFSWCGQGPIQGRIRHMEFHYVPFMGQKDKVESYALFGWDVTERAEAEHALAQSEQRLLDILAISGDWIWEIDAQGRYTHVSGRCKDLLGYEPEEILGRTPFDFMPKEEADKIRGRFLAHLAKKEPFRDLENWNVARNGRLVCIHTSGTPILGPEGELLGYRGVDTDVTAKKLSESERERMRDRLASLWKVARMTEAGHGELCNLVVDETQRLTRSKAAFFGFLSANSKVLELHGWSWETRFQCLLPEEVTHLGLDEAGLWALAIREKKTLVVNDYESWTRAKKGYPKGHVPLTRLVVVPVLDKGEVTALAAVANKDTEYSEDDVRQVETFVANVMVLLDRRKTQEELRRALQKAEEANRSKGEFLATMSHEIRTPLNGVLGMLQVLEFSGLDHEQSDFVRSALASGRTLLRILSDIIDFSRIDAKAMELADEPFELTSVVQPLLDTFRESVAAKGLVLECRVDPSLPAMFHGDAGRIRQILINLVSNAVKYTDKGVVSLDIYPLPAKRADGRMAVHFAVVDTGVGIAVDKLEQIFEAFTQVDKSFSRRHGGAGLGLPIVRRLAELMGGSLTITSEPGKGTEAHLTLWLRPVDPGTWRKGEAAKSPDDLAKSTVLLVDDDRVGRIAAKGMLARAGMDVIEAQNGKEALDVLSRKQVDLVLMDVQMPIMDGLEAVRRIRAGKDGVHNPGVPVLALTAHAMRDEHEEFLRQGMDGVVSKPLEYQELISILGRWLARKDQT